MKKLVLMLCLLCTGCSLFFDIPASSTKKIVKVYSEQDFVCGTKFYVVADDGTYAIVSRGEYHRVEESKSYTTDIWWKY